MLLSAAALIVRVPNLSHPSIWLDEGFTLLFSRLPFAQLIEVGGAHEHPPLYYILVHLALGVRNSWLDPRVVSVICGSASVGFLYLLASRLYGQFAGWISAVLLLISPFHIWYSRDGRAYELAGMFVLLSYLLLDVAWERRRFGWWVGYSVGSALALYSEYTTFFVLLPQTLYLLRQRDASSGLGAHRTPTRALCLSWLGSTVLFLPWLGILWKDTASVASDYWIPIPTLKSFGGTVFEFVGLQIPCPGSTCRPAVLPLVAGHEDFAGVLAIGVAGVAFTLALRFRNLIVALLLMWLCLPFAIVALLSLRRSLYLDRVFLDATFPLYILAGAAVACAISTSSMTAGSRRTRRLTASAGVILAGSMAVAALSNVQSTYGDQTFPDWRTPARDLAAAYRAGDRIVYYPGVDESLVSAYLPSKLHITAQSPIWLGAYLDIPGWQARYAGWTEDRLRSMEIGAAAAGHDRVWLVSQGYTGQSSARHWFAAHGFNLFLSETYSGSPRLELFDRQNPEAFGPLVLPIPGRIAVLHRSGSATITGRDIRLTGPSSEVTSFHIRASEAYVVDATYRALPPAFSIAIADVYDSRGKRLAEFPNTRWYGWPVNGVWLEQPFGFITPPGAQRVVLTLQGYYGTNHWRDVALYTERGRATGSR